MQICIVEDQLTSLAVLTGTVKRMGEHMVEGFSAPSIAVSRCGIINFDLIFVDYMMPGMNGIEMINAVRALPGYEHVPIIMITAEHDRELRIAAIEAGATDFLNKPVDPQELRVRARNLLNLRQAQLELADRALHLSSEIEKATRQLVEREREVVWRLAKAIDLRDDSTGDHVSRVASVSYLMARQLGMDRKYCETIELAATLHDTGKIGIPDAILNKPGRLNPEEMAIMRTHTTIGAALLSDGKSELMRLAEEIAHSHHERWDGSGYGCQLAGTDIPLSGRIVAIADVFDALCTERPYKRAWDLADARAEIIRQSGAHFDPACVAAFEANWTEIEARYAVPAKLTPKTEGPSLAEPKRISR
jgi:putative two-component system response regulator